MLDKKLLIGLGFLVTIGCAPTTKTESLQQPTLSTHIEKSVSSVKDISFESGRITRNGAVVLFEIDTPPMNGISVIVLKSLNDLLDVIDSDETIRSVVITGTGSVFSDSAGGTTIDPPAGMTHAQYAVQTLNRLETASVVTIAAINGKAGQGGLELAMATDIRIAAETASFSQWEVQVGLVPGFGGIQRLPRLVGHGLATDMMITGRVITAPEALSAGLVTRMAAPGSLRDEALSLARELGDIVPASSLLALKTRMSESGGENWDTALRNDYKAFDNLFGTPEFQAAMQKFVERMQASQQPPESE